MSLLSVGQQCSAQSCLLVDFLPFKCHHCSLNFCADHFQVAAHRCPQYDETRHNRVAPSCPLCNTPVAIPPGEDPNVRMERHISAECTVMTGKSGRTRSQPVCARGRCGKVLYAPIACNACKKQYCPQHRFPQDHSCSSLASTVASASKSWSTPSLTSFKLPTKTLATQTPSPRIQSTPSSSGASTPSNVASLTLPFSKTDRRAKAERESRRKAMLERAKKGLLTEQEKLLLAEEEAQRAKEASTTTNKDCSVM